MPAATGRLDATLPKELANFGSKLFQYGQGKFCATHRRAHVLTVGRQTTRAFTAVGLQAEHIWGALLCRFCVLERYHH